MAHAWYYFEFRARDRLYGVLAGRERDERVVRPVDNKCRPLDRAELFDTRTIAQNCKHCRPIPCGKRSIDESFHRATAGHPRTGKQRPPWPDRHHVLDDICDVMRLGVRETRRDDCCLVDAVPPSVPGKTWGPFFRPEVIDTARPVWGPRSQLSTRGSHQLDTRILPCFLVESSRISFVFRHQECSPWSFGSSPYQNGGSSLPSSPTSWWSCCSSRRSSRQRFGFISANRLFPMNSRQPITSLAGVRQKT